MNESDMKINIGESLLEFNDDPQAYFFVLNAYYYELPSIIENISSASEARDTATVTTYVHALKSSSVYIGATEIKNKALELEMAGKNGDTDYLYSNIGMFLNELEQLKLEIEERFGEKLESLNRPYMDSGTGEDIDRELLTRLLAACTVIDYNAISEIMESAGNGGTKAILSRVNEKISVFEYDDAIDIITGALNGN